MKNLVLIALLAAIGWQGYAKFQAPHGALNGSREAAQPADRGEPLADTLHAQPFKCDGRTYCAQMTSCREATFFLKNCPGVKMDGDNNGIPCEKQWCN